MRLIRSVLIATALYTITLISNVLVACESYIDVTLDEIKEYRSVISSVDSDPFDKLFAIEQLSCSDRPNIRNYAIKVGLNYTDEPLVRNEIMLRAMMQKARIDVELGSAATATKSDKKFVAENGGVFSKLIYFRSMSDGCMSLYNSETCITTYSVWISGDRVVLNYGEVSGSFRLSNSGELVGYLRASNTIEYTLIPAVIKLY